MSEFISLWCMIGSVIILIVGFILGYFLGRRDLWNYLQKNKSNHEKLDLRYDLEKKEVSLNGTHRIPAILYTKEQIFKMFPKKYAEKAFELGIKEDEISGL